MGSGERMTLHDKMIELDQAVQKYTGKSGTTSVPDMIKRLGGNPLGITTISEALTTLADCIRNIGKSADALDLLKLSLHDLRDCHDAIWENDANRSRLSSANDYAKQAGNAAVVSAIQKAIDALNNLSKNYNSRNVTALHNAINEAWATAQNEVDNFGKPNTTKLTIDDMITLLNSNN